MLDNIISICSRSDINALIRFYECEVVRWNPDENAYEINEAKHQLAHWQYKLGTLNETSQAPL